MYTNILNKKICVFLSFVIISMFLTIYFFVDKKLINACPLVKIETCSDKIYNSKILLQGWREQEKSGIKYVDSIIKIVDNDKIVEQFDGAIKVRGNGSSGKRKKSYGIKSKTPLKIDLQGQFGQPIKVKRFFLVSCENLNTFVGFCVSSYLQKMPLPVMRFVDVIIDGKYKGNYILMESLYDVLKKELPVGNGCFVENDLYWHRRGEVVFETSMTKYYQPTKHYMKYTVKYPKVKDCNDYRVRNIQRDINNFESFLMDDREENIENYFDRTSFVNWLLVQDILSNGDGAGSNMFLYTSSFFGPQQKHKLRMGPTWDYEYIMNNSDVWSAIKYADFFYYKYLMRYPEFQQAYYDRWREVRKFIGPYVVEQVHKLYDTQGEAIQKSWGKEAKLLGRETADLRQEVERVESWFEKRTKWLDDNIEEPRR